MIYFECEKCKGRLERSDVESILRNQGNKVIITYKCKEEDKCQKNEKK